MYYTIYKITNQINGKIYIGSHKTKNLNDNYMGSGKYLKHAIEKHGVENFTKEILFVFNNPNEMYAKEAELVNEEFLAEENTYNLKVGGFGGFDYLNSSGLNNSTKPLSVLQKAGLATKNKFIEDPVAKASWLRKMSEIGKLRYHTSESHPFKEHQKTAFLGKTHTEQTKEKMREKAALRTGEKNSSFGTMWIFNEELKHSKKIKKTDVIPDGWCKGRKMF